MLLDQLYQEIILDHYKHPHGRGLRDAQAGQRWAQAHHVNPTCGDEITVRVAADGTVLSDISYDGMGCSISQASASVLHELLLGRDTAEAFGVHAAFLELMQGRGQVAPDEDVLGDGVAFAGVARYPARVKCALLPWMAFKDAAARAGVGVPSSPEINA
ncbi:MAG TPA: SUF system NifU family Fe-S cluster assembly protein [Actinoplanes sp.]|nr:SUF system NifU family Fe-S cluster assembly protein [Actinoplanes sp.]